MAIQRKPTAGWEDILSQSRLVLEYAGVNNTNWGPQARGPQRRSADGVEEGSPIEVAAPESEELSSSALRAGRPRSQGDEKWREVMVSVQYFRDLPMLVKVSSGNEMTRLPLWPASRPNSISYCLD